MAIASRISFSSSTTRMLTSLERGCGLPFLSPVGQRGLLGRRTVGRDPLPPRQPDDEHRAGSVLAVPRLDRPAKQADQVPHDGQAETQSGAVARARGVGLPEALEDVRQEPGIDTGPSSVTESLTDEPAGSRRTCTRPPWART
jgi:hypothetical protein